MNTISQTQSQNYDSSSASDSGDEWTQVAKKPAQPKYIKVIRFYMAEEENGYLSRYFVAPFTIDGKTWQTVQHYIAAQKATDPELQEKIRLAPTPSEARQIGKASPDGFRSDWKVMRVALMKRANRAKFAQNPELAKMLVKTGNAKLLQVYPEVTNFLWGVDQDKSGVNLLGLILTEIRAELSRPAPKKAR